MRPQGEQQRQVAANDKAVLPATASSRGQVVALLVLAGMLALAGATEQYGGWSMLWPMRQWAEAQGPQPRVTAPDAWRARLPALIAFRPVSINRATAAELMAAPGIGPALATRIIAARKERGGFSSLAEVAAVSGIGRAKLAALRQLFTAP